MTTLLTAGNNVNIRPGHQVLREVIEAPESNMVSLTEADALGGKSLFMKGIMIQGEKQNQNGRTYPLHEISRAVDTINEKFAKGHQLLGEADHPDNLNINIDRISHMVTELRMDGPNGVGKLKVLEGLPMGKIVKGLLDEGVKLGVSSRGSGDVDPYGNVSNYNILTIDVVVQPSAPDAFPVGIYEAVQNMIGGTKLLTAAGDACRDPGNPLAHSQFGREMMNIIGEARQIAGRRV